MNSSEDRWNPGSQEVEDPSLRGLEIQEFLSSPTVAIFYIPLSWPIAIHQKIVRFTMGRQEIIPWGADVDWPKWFELPEQPRTKNFVLLSLHRHEHQATIDMWPWEYAKSLATQHALPAADEAKTQSDGSHLPERVKIQSSDTAATIVEAITPVFSVADQDDDPVSSAFDRCLEELNILESAYMVTSNDIRVRRTNRVTVFPFIPMQLVDPETGAIKYQATFSANIGMNFAPHYAIDLASEKVPEVGIRAHLFKAGQPLIIYMDFSFSARRALELDGDFASAVVWCQCAGEIFFDTLLQMLLWEELNFHGESTAPFEALVGWFAGRSSLESRLAKHYHSRLLGGWDPSRPDSPLYRWIIDVSRLRNRIVHAGYQPTETEAQHAVAMLEDVEGFVKTLLASDRNRNRYSRTAWMVMGEPGLRRHGAYTSRIRRLAEESAEDWHLSFASFRRSFDGALQDAWNSVS